MARLVYIPSIRPKTYLHLATNRKTGVVKLRDFSESATKEPTPIDPKMTPDEIEQLLSQHPNRHRDREPEGQDDPSIKAVGFWHDYIVKLNKTLPISHEEQMQQLSSEKLRNEVSKSWWERNRTINLVIGAIVTVIGAVVALISRG